MTLLHKDCICFSIWTISIHFIPIFLIFALVPLPSYYKKVEINDIFVKQVAIKDNTLAIMPKISPLDFMEITMVFGDDPGVCWWPPAYSTWTPTTVSFSLSVSLIVSQFIIFDNFSDPQLPEPFWGPKRHFFL